MKIDTVRDKLTKKKEKDIRILADFVSIFCRGKHRVEVKRPVSIDGEMQHILDGMELCQDCQRLLSYAVSRRLRCPYNPKPMCKRCKTHCYAPDYRARIREVMRFSGFYMVKHGRLDMMFHYFF